MTKSLWRASGVLAIVVLATAVSLAGDHGRSVLVLTSTNAASGNNVVVFKLDLSGTPSLSAVDMLPTGGNGGASANAGAVQFGDTFGAVANWGSNTVTQLVREADDIGVGRTIGLAAGCTSPDSVALTKDHLYVVGASCAESHRWPSGQADGTVVSLSDPSAAQIAVGDDWAAVTLTSGSVVQLPLTSRGALSGASTTVALPANANMVPLGEAFWGDILGFTPAHSPNSFAVMDKSRNVFPVAGPTPPFPANAPCWVAKGPGSAWYTGNSPGMAISIFFSDGQGGVFYKSVSLPNSGVPTDISVSPDGHWLAAIYTSGGEGYVAVYAVDAHGDLMLEATSPAMGIASFNGVAISQ
jgi:hypothetical protein